MKSILLVALTIAECAWASRSITTPLNLFTRRFYNVSGETVFVSCVLQNISDVAQTMAVSYLNATFSEDSKALTLPSLPMPARDSANVATGFDSTTGKITLNPKQLTSLSWNYGVVPGNPVTVNGKVPASITITVDGDDGAVSGNCMVEYVYSPPTATVPGNAPLTISINGGRPF